MLALGFLIRFSNSSATKFSVSFQIQPLFFSTIFSLLIRSFPSWPLSRPLIGANISLTLSIESLVKNEPEPSSVDCYTFESSSIFFSFSLSSLNFCILSFHPKTFPPYAFLPSPASSSFWMWTSWYFISSSKVGSLKRFFSNYLRSCEIKDPFPRN